MAHNPTPDLPPVDYTVSEFGRINRVSDKTVRRWIREGRVRSYRIGARSTRIPRAEVERLKNDSQVG